MNSDLVRQALGKIDNPNILVNTVSRRLRQLNAGGGGNNRPLITETANLGSADIALLEIIQDKMSFELVEENDDTETKAKGKASKG